MRASCIGGEARRRRQRVSSVEPCIVAASEIEQRRLVPRATARAGARADPATVGRQPASRRRLLEITCALVPLNPNELTPASDGPQSGGHGVTAVGTVIGRRAQSMCGLPA